MKRRQFFGHTLGALGLGFGGCQYLPHQGLSNPCFKSGLPEHLRNRELVQSTWEGFDVSQLRNFG